MIFVVFSHLNDSVILCFYDLRAVFQSSTEWVTIRTAPLPSPVFLLQPKEDCLVLICLSSFPPVSPREQHHPSTGTEQEGEVMEQVKALSWAQQQNLHELGAKAFVLLETRSGRGTELSCLVFIAARRARNVHTSIELKGKIVGARCWDIFGCNHGSGHSA